MKISNAELDWREDDLPYSRRFEDVYYSRDDAAGESLHVFINANRLAERFGQLAPNALFVMGELGFGSGLNFLQVLALWRKRAPETARLQYLGFEQYPLTRRDLERLTLRWPDLQDASNLLLGHYPDHSAGCHRLPLTETVVLDLHYGDATSRLRAVTNDLTAKVQCWFLDGFTPTRNPALWDPGLFRLLASCSQAGCSLSSYSVAGQVRAALTEAGFAVEKRPGFGRKRHMLAGTQAKAGTDLRFSRADTPWLQQPPARKRSGHAIVIGAGLAGCSTAYSLACRGWRVSVCEAEADPASGASGIHPLALRCRLFRAESAAAQFFLHAFLFAARQFRALLDDSDWHDTGVLQLSSAQNRANEVPLETLLALYDSAICQRVNRAQATALVGADLHDGGLLLPLAGWLEPARLCQAYLAHPAIHLYAQTPVTALRPTTSGDETVWSVVGLDGREPCAEADAVVLANSHAAASFEQSNFLPLHRVRGQTTAIPVTPGSAALKRVISGERTVFPANQGLHTIAASYSDNNASRDPDPGDDNSNQDLAARLFVSPDLLAAGKVSSRVAFRCNSADRLPVVGALADANSTRTLLGSLSRNAKARIELDAKSIESLYHPGLFVTAAHGSNGLASCPLSAEILASRISGEAVPCPDAVLDVLNPMRFLVSALKKQRAI
jgi:tRNA 5-methylaminomethyl-2-thiouridine biosynthesis bifunctional protein